MTPPTLHMGLEDSLVQLLVEMLAQRLLVDPQLLGDIGLSEAESRSALNERALGVGRLIFGGHFPLLIALLRDARAFMREVLSPAMKTKSIKLKLSQ
jgi:hypothetical protein